jgi:IPT/TIG domain
MFDLSLSSKHVTVVTSPEVTGVSPCDGPAASSTRLVIRGANLGRSRADIVSVIVAGVDCTSSLEYESSTRLTCIAGPTPSRATCSGDVIVETKSGGVGVSTVQFSFVESSSENDTNEWAAIPYDAAPAVTQLQTVAGITYYFRMV